MVKKLRIPFVLLLLLVFAMPLAVFGESDSAPLRLYDLPFALTQEAFQTHWQQLQTSQSLPDLSLGKDPSSLETPWEMSYSDFTKGAFTATFNEEGLSDSYTIAFTINPLPIKTFEQLQADPSEGLSPWEAAYEEVERFYQTLINQYGTPWQKGLTLARGDYLVPMPYGAMFDLQDHLTPEGVYSLFAFPGTVGMNTLTVCWQNACFTLDHMEAPNTPTDEITLRYALTVTQVPVDLPLVET
ncbi:MAG: hypothetical protein GX786_11145 [Clostridiales bacterium]|nr:hypothetical protein [Clostridiales bacterium]